ncbi:opacity protein-like surface antigen [Luteibacter rhizovicinus]|uniref:Opacity protein-like surface antigen n=1 Tax=Luteibacter rhizovicinus TaxID=242606 RepID=A0A4R3YH99_9GAMM|nr:hypothetical protein [Luteibacter rhizovicinus]TCV91431.1 opacity protein-like surface antigen [Luteibacter rhizovicinus]
MRSRIRHLGKATASLTILSLAMIATAAHAQDKKSQSPALDNVSIWLGGYYANNDTTLGAATPDRTTKGDVNLEKDLGFDKHKTVPRARLDFLIGEHQGFSFDYYRIDRSHGRSINEDITFLGQPFDASASVKANVKFNFGSAAYKWWFGTGNDVFGVGLGAAYYRVSGKVSGTASVNVGDQFNQSGTASASASASAWAPNLQLGWRHAFNDQWRMYVNASGVKKSGGKLNGHIWDAALGVEWFPWKNVGFGAEYAYTQVKLHQDKKNYDLDLDMKLNGPAAYVRVRF